MSEEIRLSLFGDEPELKHIWKTVFGDGDAEIDAYFERMYTPGSAAVCAIDGRLVCAAYALPLGSFIDAEGKSSPCCVVYAFGTLPEYRSRGIGTRVMEMAAAITIQDGTGVICPAEPSLFSYYERTAGYREFFYTCEDSGTDSGIPVCGSAEKITAAKYTELRKTLLSDRAYIDFSEKAMAYQEYTCSVSGGGLFSVISDGVQCAAAVELRNGAAFIKELIVPKGNIYYAAILICRALGAKNYSYRSPMRPGDEGRPFGMILNAPSVNVPDTGLAWFGFAFD